ncbi:hypothetical protein GVAV_001642 [Gurleya vavrai]
MYDVQIFGEYCKNKVDGGFDFHKIQENAIREFFKCCHEFHINAELCKHEDIMPNIDF